MDITYAKIQDNEGTKMMAEAIMTDLQNEIDHALEGENFVENLYCLAEVWKETAKMMAMNSFALFQGLQNPIKIEDSDRKNGNGMH